MSFELYTGDREVVASGSVITSTDLPIKLTLFKGEPRELVCLFNFELVDGRKEEDTFFKVEPMGKSGVSFRARIVRGTTSLLTSPDPFGSSGTTDMYGSFKIVASRGDVLELTYTFSLLKKEKSVEEAPRRKRATRKEGHGRS